MTSLPPPRPASTDADLLPIVDEQDRVIGVAPRRRVHLEGLRHRAVQVCLLDAQGRILLQRRSIAKDTCPGWWDWTCTGHVDPGETYEQAMRRELREELGITLGAGDPTPRLLTVHPASERNGWEFQAFYVGRWIGPIYANPQEVERIEPWSPEQLLRALNDPAHDPPFAPGVALGWPWLQKALLECGGERLPGDPQP